MKKSKRIVINIPYPVSRIPYPVSRIVLVASLHLVEKLGKSSHRCTYREITGVSVLPVDDTTMRRGFEIPGLLFNDCHCSSSRDDGMMMLWASTIHFDNNKKESSSKQKSVLIKTCGSSISSSEHPEGTENHQTIVRADSGIYHVERFK